ncbi:uncharacterized protein DFL_005717 [Arthrobotrys flagrans]|uniref:Wax synthase domain-containing protein n=1 Tax=Arthrobotrys flagrans TaxID=97331 RepID=A0A436ZZ37_ARTFL|nr:hypothetical protein DFL_005717 [Arthrobotrys flagrans]
MLSDSLQRAFLGLPILSVAIFALPGSSFIRYALYPLPAILILQALLQPPTEDRDVEETYLFGLFITALGFRLFDYLYLQGYDTSKHFFRVQQVGKVKQQLEYPQSIWSRIKWGFLLFISQRGIGWNFEVSVPNTKYPSNRTAFVRQAVFILLQIYLGLYLTKIGYDFMVGVIRHEISVVEYPWVYDLCKNEFFQMVIILLGWVISIISHISILYNIASIVCVGLGIGGFWGEITSWPRTFGRLRDTWSIRNVWGKTWHQSLRRSLNAPGDRIADAIFGNPSQLSYPARLVRRYFLLFSAFACSGILHAGGVYFVTVTNPIPFEDSIPVSARPAWYVSGYFFYVQAVAITLEDFLTWILRISTDEKEVQKSPVRWLFGTVYTFAWFIWSTTVLWIGPQLLSFGYKRLGDENMGHIHILEAISRSTAAVRLNPWPAIVDGALLLYQQYSKA